MSELTLEHLNPVAADKIKPFLDEILASYREKIHSIHVTGTSLTGDFDPKVSDVNSIFVLKKMDLGFLELIAPLGKKYAKKKVSAPLIMTPDYINSALDVFPVEFLNLKLIHETVFGEDILAKLEINRLDLRHQCERELKTRLIWLRQGYISSMGDPKTLTQSFVNSIPGYISLFRGIITLYGQEPPAGQADVIKALGESTGVNTDVFTKILREKREKIRLKINELNTIFEDFYAATEKLEKMIDEIRE